MKTNREILEQLPKGVAKQAIANCSDTYLNEFASVDPYLKIESISYTLSRGFIWRESIQGYNFWKYIDEEYG